MTISFRFILCSNSHLYRAGLSLSASQQRQSIQKIGMTMPSLSSFAGNSGDDNVIEIMSTKTKKEEEEGAAEAFNATTSLSPSSNTNNSRRIDNGLDDSLQSYRMSDPNQLSPSERAKQFAAYACAEAEIRSGMSLGIGSGSTIKYFVDWLYDKYSKGEFSRIKCVPTSYQVCFGW